MQFRIIAASSVPVSMQVPQWFRKEHAQLCCPFTQAAAYALLYMYKCKYMYNGSL